MIWNKIRYTVNNRFLLSELDSFGSALPFLPLSSTPSSYQVQQTQKSSVTTKIFPTMLGLYQMALLRISPSSRFTDVGFTCIMSRGKSEYFVFPCASVYTEPKQYEQLESWLT